jgi:leucyl-tRNA synthetase
MVVKDGAKMSKSKGNVVEPDTMVERFGADTTRLFSLFAAPPERDLEWSDSGVEGCFRFLTRVWRTFQKTRGRLPEPKSAAPEGCGESEVAALRRKTHDTIRRITDDLGPRMHLNTAISAVMELVNAIAPLAEREHTGAAINWAMREAFEAMARLLAPLAPHFAEELWEVLGGEGFVIDAAWPEADAALLVEEKVTVVVQVNGKLRARLTLDRGASEEQALETARADDRVAVHLEAKTLRRVVYVPDKILNLVVQ